MTAELYKIDVHHHAFLPDSASTLAKLGIANIGGLPIPHWDLASTLAMMDRQGIATTIVSDALIESVADTPKLARELARHINEAYADLLRQYPQRFGAFAAIPLPDVDGALQEVAYALDTLHLDGVMLFSSYEGQYPGDPTFDTLFAELHQRQAVVLLHPAPSVTNAVPKLNLPKPLFEFVFDTTRAVGNLLMTGTLQRFPGVRLILAHAGGTIPYLAGRLAVMGISRPDQFFVPTLATDIAGAFKQSTAALKHFYYETAFSSFPPTLRALSEVAEPSHMLFGSDYPFATEGVVAFTTQALASYAGFDDQTRRAVEYENALALFPRLQSLWVEC